ncbi:MAG: class II SORL domain-containing protein [Candidatus Saelkia tenebricola]|nr:class II SORL domain-containing protein [Candidatus Saelkia tenebricola]
MDLKDLFQSADWKQEKHVPVIDIVEQGEIVKIAITVGKEIPHPNTTEHHICWIEVYFVAEGEKIPSQLGRFEFTSHGESIGAPNAGSVHTSPEVVVSFKAEKPGTILASSYCNIHGLWQSSVVLSI